MLIVKKKKCPHRMIFNTVLQQWEYVLLFFFFTHYNENWFGVLNCYDAINFNSLKICLIFFTQHISLLTVCLFSGWHIVIVWEYIALRPMFGVSRALHSGREWKRWTHAAPLAKRNMYSSLHRKQCHVNMMHCIGYNKN